MVLRAVPESLYLLHKLEGGREGEREKREREEEKERKEAGGQFSE